MFTICSNLNITEEEENLCLLNAITGEILPDLSDKLHRAAVINKYSAVECVERTQLMFSDNGVKCHRALYQTGPTCVP